jgi:hypothetical protein
MNREPRIALSESASFSLAGLITARRLRVYPPLMLASVVLYTVHDVWQRGLRSDLGGDFLSFYTGGAFVLRGNLEGLAHGAQQHALQEQILGFTTNSTGTWVSPPFFACLFAPFAALPFPVAYAVFTLASIGSCAVAFGALRKAFASASSTSTLLLTAAQFYPTLHALIIGQTSALWLSVFVWVFVRLRQGRDAQAGLLLGLFVCKPPLALGLAVALLAARRFRTLAFAALSGGALLGSGLVLMPDLTLRYLHAGPKLVSFVRDAGYPVAGLVGSFEFGTLLFDGISRPLGAAAGFSLLAGLLLLIASFWVRTPWRPGTRAWDLRMAATLGIGVIASPHLFSYDLLLLVLPFFVVMFRFPERAEMPLGNPRLLELSFVLWLLAFATPLLSGMQRVSSQQMLGFTLVVQLIVPVIAAWGVYVFRQADSPG